MKDRILTGCVVISLLFHLSVVAVFLSQQKKDILLETTKLRVSLIQLADSGAVHLEKSPVKPAEKSKENKVVIEKKTEIEPLLPKATSNSTPSPSTDVVKAVETAEQATFKPKVQSAQLEVPLAEPAPVSSNIKEDQSRSEPLAVEKSIEPTRVQIAVNETTDTDQHDSFSGPLLLNPSLVAGPNSPPTYPRIARRRGWEGEVWLIAQIATNGRVRKVQLEQSSGHGILDQTALKTVRDWLFQPQYLQNRSVEYEVRIPVRFELRDS